MQTSMSFLLKRLHPYELNKVDRNKLHRAVHCIYATMYLETMIGIEYIVTIMAFVYASFAAHGNMRGHTVLTIASALVFSCHNQKLNLSTRKDSLSVKYLELVTTC